MDKSKTSALLIIGNEILSGRTLDKNTQYIGEAMAKHGVPLAETRVVPDVEARIVEAVNALRQAYDYVFTTGGIGPTHDDITADSIAVAFSTHCAQNEAAYQILLDYYGAEKLTPERLSMAQMPVHDDVDLVLNPVSAAPGFRIGNVFVMAGVPNIMQAMLDSVLDMITPGEPILSRAVILESPESAVAQDLGKLQDQYPDVDIGSYPQFKQKGGWGVSVVFRGRDDLVLEKAQNALLHICEERGLEASIF